MQLILRRNVASGFRCFASSNGSSAKITVYKKKIKEMQEIQTKIVLKMDLQPAVAKGF